MVRRPLPPEGNDVSDIFDEINEDLRAERAHRLMRRYGGLLAGMAVLAILGVGTYQGWKYYQQQQTARQADSFLAATRIADGPDDAQRQAALPAFAKLAQDGNAGYRTLSRLREAALKAAGGDGAGAAALWNQISADSSADPLLRDLASLQWTMHQIDAGDPAAIQARLAPLAATNNPWHALAQEQQALLALRQGHKDAAIDILKRLGQDVTAPDGVRGRANGLLAELGSPAGGS
jgi:hypothetical protein